MTDLKEGDDRRDAALRRMLATPKPSKAGRAESEAPKLKNDKSGMKHLQNKVPRD
jgi:hypothetical protein